MELLKICRECNKAKDLSSFYKHSQMLDGHLNKCKSCVKERVKKHRSKNILRIREYDRSRSNNPNRVEARKSYLLTEKGREVSIKAKKDFSSRYPKKRKASSMVNNALKTGKLSKKPCEICGTMTKVQAHHDDYDKPLDVRWLCLKHHSEWHKFNKAINGE